jgi:hypothetical protein
MTTELLTADQYIYEILTGDTALQESINQRVYSEGHKNPSYPCAQFKRMSGRDTNGVCGYRASTNALYIISAVVKDASFAEADSVAERIDAVMSSIRVVTNGRIFTCIREEPYSRVEEYDGVTYHHQGGLYRIMIRPVET